MVTPGVAQQRHEPIIGDDVTKIKWCRLTYQIDHFICILSLEVVSPPPLYAGTCVTPFCIQFLLSSDFDDPDALD